MRFKKEVGIQDIPTNFMLLTEVTYFEELRVIQDKFSTYNEIIQKYINYVQSKYRKYVVVFEWYRDGPSTKDHGHCRRLMKVVISPDEC